MNYKNYKTASTPVDGKKETIVRNFLSLAVAATLSFAFSMPLVGEAAAKKRSEMTEKEKKELRKRAREYCLKAYAKGTSELERVEIKSTGKVVCWIRN
jgi:hypothetical protein